MTASIPDVHSDYLGAVAWLIEQTARNAEALKDLKNAIGVKDSFGVSDLARRWNVSESSLRSDPVRLPNYGRSDIGQGKKLWRRETVEAWEELSEEEHRDIWDRMSFVEKQKYIGPVRRSVS
jgi:hypothetical protein